MRGLVERFLEYVKIDTQSDPYSDSTPAPKNSGIWPTNWWQSLKTSE